MRVHRGMVVVDRESDGSVMVRGYGVRFRWWFGWRKMDALRVALGEVSTRKEGL